MNTILRDFSLSRQSNALECLLLGHDAGSFVSRCRFQENCHRHNLSYVERGSRGQRIGFEAYRLTELKRQALDELRGP
jgi:hypothetical protein